MQEDIFMWKLFPLVSISGTKKMSEIQIVLLKFRLSGSYCEIIVLQNLD